MFILTLDELSKSLNWKGEKRQVLELDWGPSGVVKAPGRHAVTFGSLSQEELCIRVAAASKLAWGKVEPGASFFLVESEFMVAGLGTIKVNAFTKNRVRVTLSPYTEKQLREEFDKWTLKS